MRYKIIKHKSAPPLSVNELSIYRKCYLGISINNPFFRDRHLGILLKWISSHFDECVIIIGDYLHRINETILHGKTGEDAISSGINLGNQVSEILSTALSPFPSNKFTVIRWKQYMDDNPNSFEEKEKLLYYFNTNTKFRNSIMESCEKFIEKLTERGHQIYVTKDGAIQLSKEYLIEEMAVFSTLIQKGYKVQVYPGTQLNVLKELANHEFDELDTPLKEGVYIDLTAKKIK